MNLAQAVAVFMYELVRTSGKPEPRRLPSVPDANLETLGRINDALREALDLSGYIHPRSAASAKEKLHRMLLRLDMNAPDGEVLLGMLRKILWKLTGATRKGT